MVVVNNILYWYMGPLLGWIHVYVHTYIQTKVYPSVNGTDREPDHYRGGYEVQLEFLLDMFRDSCASSGD